MISICIPFHLRGEINQAYQIAFRYYASLPYPVTFCGSEGAFSRAFVEEWLSEKNTYVEVPQARLTTSSKGDEVLRKKFNDSLATLPESEWYCLVGADDIVPRHVFEHLETFTTDRPCMFGMEMGGPMYLLDMNKVRGGVPKAYKLRLKYRVQLDLMGGVNAFNAAAMKVCPNPYQREGCETGAELHFREHYTVASIPGYVVMPKVPSALNTLEKLLAFHERMPMSDADMEIVKMYL